MTTKEEQRAAQKKRLRQKLLGPREPLDVFVRAPQGELIQLGIADPEQEYGIRPVEIVLINRRTAYWLICELAKHLSETEPGKTS